MDSFHCRSSTTAPPPSDDAGEDIQDGGLSAMPLFADSKPTSNNTAPPIEHMEKEHMFDKVVTPSDVGKLNRLVIPKQHAEKYFPLDSSANEKGLFLNFEDRNGKPWRFRYSYWNSSQSYVMTKGWSRFVKEKKLDAGDVVSFQRGLGEMGRDRLFIDWRRRPDAPHNYHHYHQLRHPSSSLPPPLHHHQFSSYYRHRPVIPWTTSTSMVYHQPDHLMSPYSSIVDGNPCPPGSLMYLRSMAGNGYGSDYGAPTYPNIVQMQRGNCSGDQQQHDSIPVVQGKAAAAKSRLRLFGVNIEEPNDEAATNWTAANQSTTHTTMNSYGGFNGSSLSLFGQTSLSLRPYNGDDGDDVEEDEEDDKGKGVAMSLDLEI